MRGIGFDGRGGGGGAFKKDCRLEGEGSSISLTPTMGNLVYMSNYGQNF